MRCIPNQGLRFSFENKNIPNTDENPGSETPRFGQVELNNQSHIAVKSIKTKQRSNRSQMSELRFSFERRKDNSLHSYIPYGNQSKKIKASAKLQELQIGENKNMNEQNNSVRSVQSLKERLASRSNNKRMLEVKKRILNNSTRSLACLFQRRKGDSQGKQGKNIDQNLQKQLFPQEGLTNTPNKSRQQTAEQGSKLLQMGHRTSPQSKIDRLKHKALSMLGGQSSEKKRQGKSFKGIFNRGKPILQLQLQASVQSNQKIEYFSKHFEEFKESN